MAQSFPPKTMRAWQYTSTEGGLEKNLQLVTSVPLPAPDSSKHLIQVIATGLNPVDYKLPEITLLGRFAITKPAVPCGDFSGVIITPASGSALKRGDLVFGVSSKSLFQRGALAEFVNGDPDCVVPIPNGVNVLDAATLPTAGLTAFQSIVPHVKEGDQVFINGGSGGTGVMGIQVAKAAGCHVTTTCSAVNIDLCRRLGADEVIDYKSRDVLGALKDFEGMFDHVVDNVGEDKKLYYKAHEFMKPKAKYLVVGVSPNFESVKENLKLMLWPGWLGGGKRKAAIFYPIMTSSNLAQFASWIKEGKVKVVIDQTFPFEQVPEAYKKLKTERTKGKIVIDIASQTYQRNLLP